MALPLETASAGGSPRPTRSAELAGLSDDAFGQFIEAAGVKPGCLHHRLADLQRIDSNQPDLHPRGVVIGNPKGNVTLVEFFDYACTYCRASLPDIDRLLAEDKKLKIVYRELPILSEESNLAARVSLFAAEQGKYGPFHKALYAGGHVTKESILAAAAATGLDRKATEAAMNSNRYDPEIENNLKLAQDLGASGTPTFVVGNRILNGAVGYDALKEAVSAAACPAK